MQKAMGSAAKALQSAVARDGFAFVHAPEMRESLESFGALGDWSSFSESWNDLALDTYMADGGRYRRRRHAVYTVRADGAVRRRRIHGVSALAIPAAVGHVRVEREVVPAFGEG